MTKTAIFFDRVSKRFLIHRDRPRSLQELALNLLRLKGNGPREEFWALRDVSFDVSPGEMVGIIGPNGAGKSTILKLISRVIEPTSGQVITRGRVSALLELGVGFHPDLTGRENVFLNGSILGLSRREIARRFDDISDFAGIGSFIDAPVRLYSSGMYMRLGFSVAVHTNPEILLVDEVLAVGDATFQHKCLERIGQLREGGTTILLVSHDLDVVRRMCQRTIWLNRGVVLADGEVEKVVQQYMWSSYEEGAALVAEEEGRRWGTGEIQITAVRLLDEDGQERRVFGTGDPIVVEMHYWAKRRVLRPVFGLAIHRSDGVHITGPNTQFAGYEIPWVEGKGTVVYRIDRLPLLEGQYNISVAARDWEDITMYDYHDRLYPFQMVASNERHGMVTLEGVWQCEQ